VRVLLQGSLLPCAHRGVLAGVILEGCLLLRTHGLQRGLLLRLHRDLPNTPPARPAAVPSPASVIVTGTGGP
jgi:hypothetical protein